MIFKPYCYILHFPNLNLRYVGLKFHNSKYRNQILVNYFSSSPKVKSLIQSGENVILEHKIEFDDINDAIEYEYQKLILVKDDPLWINQKAVKFSQIKNQSKIKPKGRVKYSKPGDKNYKQSVLYRY